MQNYRFSSFIALFFLCFTPLIQAEEMSSQDIVKYYSQIMNEPGNITFTPPKGWHFIDPNIFKSRPHVKVAVIGKGSHEYSPNINLGVEPLKVTLKEYMRQAKAHNDALHDQYKDLGTIKTEGGEAHLIQVDIKGQWGDERLMHVMLEKEGMLYTLTVAALKEEFPRFYQDFFASIRSLRFNLETAVGDNKLTQSFEP